MGAYRIVYDRNGCIGAGTCEALDPDNFKLVEDGLADLIDGEEVKDGVWVKEISEDEKDTALEAAKGCPVNVIKIMDAETNKQIYP